MAGAAHLFESSVLLTITHFAHHDMCAGRAGERSEVFSFDTAYDILVVSAAMPVGGLRPGRGAGGAMVIGIDGGTL